MTASPIPCGESVRHIPSLWMLLMTPPLWPSLTDDHRAYDASGNGNGYSRGHDYCSFKFHYWYVLIKPNMTANFNYSFLNIAPHMPFATPRSLLTLRGVHGSRVAPPPASLTK